jgi:glycosidase
MNEKDSALDVLERTLRKKKHEHRGAKARYFVPGLWVSPSGRGKAIRVDPFGFYLGIVRKAKTKRAPRPGKPTGGEWSSQAVIYNMFVRTTAAFDHDRSGKLDLPVNAFGFRETGTFLKAIAMLPYIKRIGANTIHLLPITAIGQDGNKGTLGSPYAIRNPYELDENLSEPLLGLDAKTEFKAFVEAAHRMGFRVVVEFVFRTAAKDGDWVKENPDWMYWIKESIPVRDPAHQDESRYGSPLFTAAELEKIHKDIQDGRMDNLLPPHKMYREFFTLAPDKKSVTMEDGRYVGRLADGMKVKIPGAFADWPPDDNQPPWGDVTYLKLYDHPDFNYIGYNTIRMYDTRLTEPANINRPLWDKIVGIVPHYQREFGIDGVMIDMGHALPKELKAEMVATARKGNPDFAFWDENFSITERSREEGYNAVFGYLWVDEHHADRIKKFIRRLSTEGFPIPFFATPENHNTPRAAARTGGTTYSRWAFVINCFLPGIPFIHSGYELAERYPINTGLDFTPEEIKKLPSERLPLFSEYGYNWTTREELSPFLKKVLALRMRHLAAVIDPSPESVRLLEPDDPSILAYARVPAKGGKSIAVISNADFRKIIPCKVPLGTAKNTLTDALTGKKYRAEHGAIVARLHPGQSLLVEF